MNELPQDAALIAVLVERFEKQRLPRAQSLKQKVDRGELLDEFDIAFLEEVFSDATKIKPIVDRHPEYEELVARAVHLYREITDKALENEKLR